MSQLLELRGSGRMEINNLSVKLNNYCTSCCSTQCRYKGQNGHLNSSGRVIDSPENSCHNKGSTNWKFSGNGCFDFQNKRIHLDLAISSGKTVGSNCKLMVALDSCTSSGGRELEMEKIEQASVALRFFDSGNKTEIIDTKYIRISGLKENLSKKLQALDDEFCSIDEFLKICQHHPGGTSRKTSHGESSREHQFVSLQVDLCIFLNPVEADGSDKFFHTTCNTLEQLEVKIKNKPNNILQHEFKTASKENCDEAEAKSVSSMDLLERKKQGYDQVTAVTTHTSKFSWNFSDRVDIKCGTELQHTLTVYKNVLTDNSPVFRTMLETKMKEAAAGEIKMPTVSLDVLNALISFLYGTKDVEWIKRDVELMIGILELAHQYEMKDLITNATEILVSIESWGLTIKTALQVYACGYMLDISDLQCRALQWLMENKDSVPPDEEQMAMAEFLKTENAAAISLFIRLHAGLGISP